MADIFTIYLDRLKEGRSQKIQDEVSADFLEIDEEDLHFEEKVQIDVEAYLAEDHLVLHMSASTSATAPCTICNQPTKTILEIKNVYHTEDLKEVRSYVFNFKDILRETLLLELAHFVECNEGNCPERTSLVGFLSKNETPAEKNTTHPTYFPFADLEKK